MSIYNMLDKNTCNFILVTILVIMLIYYSTTGQKENYMVGDFNKANKLNEIFQPGIFDSKNKVFYISVANIRGKDGKYFLTDREDYFNNLVLGTNMTDASMIYFKEDSYNPDLWNIKVINETMEELLTLVSGARKMDAYHQQILTGLQENYEDRLTYLPGSGHGPENLQAPISRLPVQGIRSQDSMDIGWDSNLNTKALGVLGGTISSDKIVTNNNSVATGGIILGRHGQGMPLSFRIKREGNQIQIFHLQLAGMKEFPMVVDEDGNISIDYSGLGQATTFELWLGSGLSGGVLAATLTMDRQWILKMKPGPGVGTIVAIGKKSPKNINHLQEIAAGRKKSDFYELLGEIDVNVPGLIKQDIIPYLFRVVCNKDIIRKFMAMGSPFGQHDFLSTKHNLHMPSIGNLHIRGANTSEVASDMSTPMNKLAFTSPLPPAIPQGLLNVEHFKTPGDLGTLNALTKSGGVYQTGGTNVTDDSVGDDTIEVEQKKYFKKIDPIVKEAEDGGLGEIADIDVVEEENKICVDNNLYVVQILDYTGRYILHGDGHTTDTITNQPGPRIDLFLEPDILQGKTWIRMS